MRKTVYSLLSVLSAAVLSLSLLSSTRSAETTLADSSTATNTSPRSSSTPSSTTPSTTDAPSPGATSSADTQGGSASDTTTPSTGLKDGTYTGESTDTPYGPVQVEVVVSGGTITSAQAVTFPNSSGHDQMINSRAVPLLNSEVVDAQGVQISMVTGATYTSEGYLTSLQSALDQAAS